MKNLNIWCKKKAREFEIDYFESKLMYKIQSVENKLHLQRIMKKWLIN